MSTNSSTRPEGNLNDAGAYRSFSGPVPSIGDFSVYLDPAEVVVGESFEMTVTAYRRPAVSEVDTYGADSVTLADGYDFADVDSYGTIRYGRAAERFGWGGKSENQLTSAFDYGHAEKGSRAEYVREVDGDYYGNPVISAWSGGRRLPLEQSSMEIPGWSGGSKTIENTVTGGVVEAGSPIVIEVHEEGAGAHRGRWGAWGGPGTGPHFYVELPCVVGDGYTPPEDFPMRVVALDGSGQVLPDYAADCTIEHTGTGELSPDAIPYYAWEDGEVITYLTYDEGMEDEFFEIIVREAYGDAYGMSGEGSLISDPYGFNVEADMAGGMCRSVDQVVSDVSLGDVWMGVCSNLGVSQGEGITNGFTPDLGGIWGEVLSADFWPSSDPDHGHGEGCGQANQPFYRYDVSNYIGRVRRVRACVSGGPGGGYNNDCGDITYFEGAWVPVRMLVHRYDGDEPWFDPNVPVESVTEVAVFEGAEMAYGFHRAVDIPPELINGMPEDWYGLLCIRFVSELPIGGCPSSETYGYASGDSGCSIEVDGPLFIEPI